MKFYYMQFTNSNIIKFFSLFKKKLDTVKTDVFLKSWKIKLNNESKKHCRIVEKHSFIWKFIPWIKAVFICNTTAFGSANTNSDIDLFIITKNNSLWICRIFTTIFIHLLWIRRHWNKIANRFCLSFFATEQGSYELENLEIEKNNDPYLAIWTATLIPIFWNKKYLNTFYQKNNWIEKYNLFTKKWIINIKSKDALQCVSTNSLLEILFKKIFIPKTIKKYNLLKDKTWTIISDKYLKFHDNDIRKQIKNELL